MLGLELFPLGTAIVLCVFALLWLAVAVVVQRQSNAVDDGATGYTLISEPPTDHIDGHRGGPGVANTLREPLLRDDDEPPAAPPAIERQFTFSPKHAGGDTQAEKRYLVKSRVPLATRIVGARLNALGQAGEPRDVAGAVAFLCGRGSRGVNGQVLRVCGGFMGGR